MKNAAVDAAFGAAGAGIGIMSYASVEYFMTRNVPQTNLWKAHEEAVRLSRNQACDDGLDETNIGESGIRYTPATPGPLPQNIAETFTGGSYTEKVLTQDTTFYRVYGGDAGQVGRYLSGIPQQGRMQSQLDLALNPDWGNTAEYVIKIVVPKGTIIYEGTAAPQVINGGAGQLLGGGNQVYIPEVNALWFGN